MNNDKNLREDIKRAMENSLDWLIKWRLKQEKIARKISLSFVKKNYDNFFAEALKEYLRLEEKIKKSDSLPQSIKKSFNEPLAKKKKQLQEDLSEAIIGECMACIDGLSIYIASKVLERENWENIKSMPLPGYLQGKWDVNLLKIIRNSLEDIPDILVTESLDYVVQNNITLPLIGTIYNGKLRPDHKGLKKLEKLREAEEEIHKEYEKVKSKKPAQGMKYFDISTF